MSLVKSTLTLQIYQALSSLSTAAQAGTLPLPAAQLQAAEAIATAIDTYIKSATIIVPPGQTVTTAGSPAAQSGTTVSPSLPAIIT